MSETLGYDRDLIAAAVDNGVCELWKLWGGKSWAVTRIEMGVLTCCCYQGVEAMAWMAWLMEQGQRMNLTAVQYYSARPGLARMLAQWGFRPIETVYRAEVPKNGREAIAISGHPAEATDDHSTGAGEAAAARRCAEGRAQAEQPRHAPAADAAAAE